MCTPLFGTHHNTDSRMQYSFSNVKKMEPLVDARIQQWSNKLDENFAQSGKAFDFAWWAV